MINGSAWDTFRTTMDSTGHIAKILDKMPHANYFGAGDGLNTAGFRWVRGTSGQGGGSAAAGVSDFVNRKQFNLKIDENFEQAPDQRQLEHISTTTVTISSRPGLAG